MNTLKKKISFEDLPSLMADLLIQMELMNDRMKDVEKKFSPPTTVNPEKELITSAEVCKLLKVSRITVYRMANRGDIPCYRNGKTLLFYKDDVMNWINSSPTNGHLMSIRTVDDFMNSHL